MAPPSQIVVLPLTEENLHRHNRVYAEQRLDYNSEHADRVEGMVVDNECRLEELEDPGMVIVKSFEHVSLSTEPRPGEASRHKSGFLTSNQFERVWKWVSEPDGR